MDWNQIFTDAFGNFWSILIGYIPKIIGAAIILLIGWLIAVGLEKLVVKLMRFSKLDKLMQKTGVSDHVDKLGGGFDLAYIIGKIVKWFILLITLIAVADALSIPQIAQFIDKIVLYLPNVFAAVIILIIGFMLGGFLEGIVSKAAKKIQGAEFIAMAAKWAVIIMAVMAALVQLSIAKDIIEILFTGLVIAFTLAIGLAFGLGGRDHAARALDSMIEKGKKEARKVQEDQQDES